MAVFAPEMRILPASDRSLVVSVGNEISAECHHRVVALTRAFETEPIPGVLNIHPAYCSVLVVFDPLRTEHSKVESAIRNLLPAKIDIEPAALEIPVCYGGEFGPDLEELAARHDLSPKQAIELHASAQYTVYFIGFVPGFTYLGGLPEKLATPRLDTPRRRVPAGSVGIAGAQTGVYPVSTPGGWRIIGRTPLELFRIGRQPLSLVQIGDHVRFTPIPRERM